jgi:hypothetical protein
VFLQTNSAQRVLSDDSQYGTTGWTLFVREYTTTADETSLAPVLTSQDDGGGEAYAFFDDLGLYKGALPPSLAAVYLRYQRNQQGVCDSSVILSKSGSLTVWADDLAARVYREDGVPNEAKPAPAAQLTGARGEQNYVQAVLTPRRELTEVTLRPTDLKGPGAIAAAQVQWWPVGFVNVQQTHRQNTRKGWTPDPLLRAEPVTAPAGQNTPFLVGVTIPRNARPGQYKGQVDILAGGAKVGSIPLALTVYGFALPRNPVFRTLITYSASLFTKWDKRPLPQIEQDICRLLYAHGVRGNGAIVTAEANLVDGKVVCDFTSFDEKVGWNLGELGFTAFFLGPGFGGGTSEGWEKHSQWLGMEPLSADFNRLFPEYLRQVAQHLRDNNWLDKAYLYPRGRARAGLFRQGRGAAEAGPASRPRIQDLGDHQPELRGLLGCREGLVHPVLAALLQRGQRRPPPAGRRRDLGLQHPGHTRGRAPSSPALVLAGSPLRRHWGAAMERQLLQRH